MSKYILFLKIELLLVSRLAESFVSILFFSFLILLMLHFALGVSGREASPWMIPTVWIATLFGGMLRMNRTYEPEQPGHVMEGLRMIRGVLTPFFLSKLTLNFLFLLVLMGCSFLLVVILFNIPQPLMFLRAGGFALVLGTFGLACIGTTFSGMLVSHKRRDLILPVIAYPILMPLSIAVLKILVFGADGALDGVDAIWFKILVVFDLVYFVGSLMVFELIVES